MKVHRLVHRLNFPFSVYCRDEKEFPLEMATGVWGRRLVQLAPVAELVEVAGILDDCIPSSVAACLTTALSLSESPFP